MRNYKNAESIIDVKLKLGEGIIWDNDNYILFWVEMIEPSSIFKWEYKTNRLSKYDMPEMVTALSLINNKELLVACKKSISIFNYKSHKLSKLIDIEEDIPNNRLNDAGTDAKGRFWFGTMQNTITEAGELLPINNDTGAIYSIDENLNLNQFENNLACTNTFVWNNKNDLMYFTDSTSKNIYKYRYNLEEGKIYNKSVFVKIDENATPDGSAIDTEDHLWTCFYGSGKIIRFKPNSEIDSIYNIPALGVTNCIFGGENMETLYVTTGRMNFSKDQLKNYPLSGNIFKIETGVVGKSDNNYILK